MAEPKFTLAQILEAVRKRPTTPELELAVHDFLELSEVEQRTILFRELCQLTANLNWCVAQLQNRPPQF